MQAWVFLSSRYAAFLGVRFYCYASSFTFLLCTIKTCSSEKLQVFSSTIVELVVFIIYVL